MSNQVTILSKCEAVGPVSKNAFPNPMKLEVYNIPTNYSCMRIPGWVDICSVFFQLRQLRIERPNHSLLGWFQGWSVLDATLNFSAFCFLIRFTICCGTTSLLS